MLDEVVDIDCWYLAVVILNREKMRKSWVTGNDVTGVDLFDFHCGYCLGVNAEANTRTQPGRRMKVMSSPGWEGSLIGSTLKNLHAASCPTKPTFCLVYD